MESTHKGNVPGIGQWDAPTQGIFQGLADGMHPLGEYSRDWPMGCTHSGNVPGLANETLPPRGFMKNPKTLKLGLDTDTRHP